MITGCRTERQEDVILLIESRIRMKRFKILSVDIVLGEGSLDYVDFHLRYGPEEGTTTLLLEWDPNTGDYVPVHSHEFRFRINRFNKLIQDLENSLLSQLVNDALQELIDRYHVIKFDQR